jgi:N-acyl-L-homoserine lactone synthetase
MARRPCLIRQADSCKQLRLHCACNRAMEIAVLQLITPASYDAFAEQLAEMYRLRYRVFKDRLGWDVPSCNDFEKDAFDTYKPTYLILIGHSGRVYGCVRFLPTTGPTMLRDVFPQLLDGKEMPDCPLVWECSRFAVDHDEPSPTRVGGISAAAYELMAGMVEFGLSQGMKEIVTVTDVRLEKISRRAQWGLRRIGSVHVVGNTSAVAGYLDVSKPALVRLLEGGGLKGPVLWAPVVSAKAA